MSKEISRIGIVGGGQLGRMLTIPALEMGYKVVVVDPTPNSLSPAAQVGAQQIEGNFTDTRAIGKLFTLADVVTIEIEHVDCRALRTFAEQFKIPVFPDPGMLDTIKDKFTQKSLLRNHLFPVANFMEVKGQLSDDHSRVQSLNEIGEELGYPFMLKSRFGGYDGRSNQLIESQTEVSIELFKKFQNQSLYAEEWVDFEKELAVIVTQGENQLETYPVVETVHKENICHEVVSPADISEDAKNIALGYAKRFISEFGSLGTTAIEMFLITGGRVLINEIAPRVHNSGHLTIEACQTSQFANHIRGITGMGLGPADMIAPCAAMINILGESETPESINLAAKKLSLAVPDAVLHWYGKSHRLKRKLGHITVLGDNRDVVINKIRQARGVVNI